MDKLKAQLILNLKSRFLDLISMEDGLLNYQYLLEKMLTSIKNLTDSEEVTLVFCNSSTKEIYVEASTENEKDIIFLPSIACKGLFDFLITGPIMRSPISIVGFERYDLVLSLFKEDGYNGCLVFRSKHSFTQFDDSLLKQLSLECSRFLNKVQFLSKVLSEEKRYKQLFRVTEKFHSSMNMDVVLGEIIKTLKEVYPTFTYYLLLSHDNNNHSNLPIKDLEYDSENLAAMQAYVTGSIQFEDSIQEKRSVLYAPLKGKQGVYGVLQVITPNTLMFPEDEVEFITLLANTAGSALENAQLYQQSKRLISDLQLINETSHRLNSNLRLTETMTFMAEQIIKSFNAEVVGFVLMSNGSKDYIVVNGSSQFFYTKDAKKYITYIYKKMEVEQDSLFIGDLSLKEEAGEVRFKSIMAVPMVQTGVNGFALVMHQDPYHFSFDNFKLLQSLIHHSTLAFTNAMLREELEKMVITDHLTKLYSRNYLDTNIHLSMEKDLEGTFILIDIDDFKSVNDTYGHQVGDEVLIQVADIIKTHIRKTDIGSRWGGEELAIYLPNTPLKYGVVIAGRLVEAVSEYSNPHVTISCGVSYWEKDLNVSFKGLFKKADTALYIAKESGKNKVIVQNELQ
ncbi:diguanylate cyclase domain-containing protein [Cytobacillus sp. Hz8]|uniref:sensor domain-containing diguanylate cyclase n=1 Tax=Cytobacillus sp. Hz8 TaxID=3347168 RepID=UPI0035DEE463